MRPHRFTPRLRTVLVAGVAALVAGAGSATAASLVTSTQIKDGTIREADVHAGTADNEFYGFVTTYMPADKVIRVVVRDADGKPADGAGFNLDSSC